MKPTAHPKTKTASTAVPNPGAGPWWKSSLARRAGMAFSAVVVAGILVWLFAFRPYVFTDDARVEEDLIRVAPDGVSGTVEKVNVEEGDRVAQGQVLAELDHSTYQAGLAKAQAKAILAQADFNRANRLYKQGGLTEREFQATLANSQSAQADLQLAQEALDHTYLKSPVDGLVVKKMAVAGNILGPSQVALMVADVDHAWVAANIQETSVGAVKIGQPVEIKVDEGGKLTGRVSEITAAAASEFALLPAENASGNYIKLVQRIPIKVALDPHPGRVLRAGQSVEISIKVH